MDINIKKVGSGYVKFRSSRGFTLIELAIVIIVSGLIMIALARFIKLYTVNIQYEKTIENLRISQSAIDEYFGLYGYYPCPADPTLPPSDPQYGRSQCRAVVTDDCVSGVPGNIVCTNAFSRDGDQNGQPDTVLIGIIPFRTLSEDIVATKYDESKRLDGYSTYISYAVTEHMTDSSRFDVVNPVNPNTGGIRVEDENEISLTTPDDSVHYVLYSHGDNRRGGYSSSGTRIGDCSVSLVPGVPPSVPAPGPSVSGIDDEIENCDNNDAIFKKGIRSLADNGDYNDDILFFRSSGTKYLWKYSLVLNNRYIYNTNLGNVGVGTQNPMYKLHIVGDVSAQSNTMADGYCDGASNDCLDPNAIGGTGSSCPNSRQVAYAIQNNQIVCRDVEWVFPATKECPAGEFLVGISNLGNIRCAAP